MVIKKPNSKSPFGSDALGQGLNKARQFKQNVMQELLTWGACLV
jgi:hypothetical protein